MKFLATPLVGAYYFLAVDDECHSKMLVETNQLRCRRLADGLPVSRWTVVRVKTATKLLGSQLLAARVYDRLPTYSTNRAHSLARPKTLCGGNSSINMAGWVGGGPAGAPHKFYGGRPWEDG